MAGDLQLRVRLSADGQQLIGELKAAENSVQKFGSTVASGIVTAAKWATGIVAAGAAVTTYLVAANADAIRQIDQFADSLGMSTQTLTEWQYAAESVGVAGENMQSIFQDLQDKIGDFATTGGGEATDVFESLNIAVADLMNLSPAEQLTAIADAMQDVNQNQKVFFMESLASDSTRLLPLLENNAAALKKLQLEAQVLGRSISDVDAAKVTESALAIDRTQGLITGLANEITVSLAPMLTGVSNMLFESAVEAGGFGNAVETAVDGAVTGLGFVLDVGQQFLVWNKHAQIGLITMGQAGTSAMAAFSDTTANVINTVLRPFQGYYTWLIDKFSSLVNLAAKLGGPFADEFKDASAWLDGLSKDVENFKVGGSDIIALNEAMKDSLASASAELDALLNANAPSDDLKNWVQRLREESEAAAAASVRLRNESKSTGIVVGNDAAAYASTLAKSTSSSVKSLSDVEKQSQRVWSALAAGKISTAQAAAAIDGVASAGAGLVSEQQQWIDQMIAAMDPARALQEEIAALQETFEDGLFGDLSEDKFNDYIDSLKKKLAELNGVKIQDPAVQMGSAMQTAAGGIKDVAGAMQGMYSEGERGYQNMAVAMQTANVLAAVGAVLQQGNANPWTAFANMAAMAAAVAGLGYSVGSMGGGFEDTAAIRQAEQGTGTVLGDSSAKSESIAKAIDITATATSELVGINRGMLRALQGVQAGISGATTRIARGAGNVDFGEVYKPTNAFDSISGLGQKAFNVLPDLKILDTLSAGLFSGIFKGVGKLLGGSSSVTDEGIRLLGGTMSDMMDSVAVEAYQTVKSKKYRWSSSKTRENFEALDDDVGRQFALVFESLADSVYEGATALGFVGDDVADKINNFVIETQKISLKGLDAEEQQAEIESVFSVMFDNLAESTVAFLPKFQQAGEALGETLARVATNVQVTEEAVFRLGFAAENINPEQFASLSVYLIDAAGGMEQFISSMSSFVDKFAPESHRLDLLSADMERSLAAVGLSVPSTRDEMWELMQALDATTEAGADQIATLLMLTDTAESYYKTLEAAANFNRSVQQQLDRIRLSGQDLALYNLDSEFDQLRKEAAKVGGDLANIEKLYGQKRAAVLAEFAEQIEGDQQQSSAAAQNASHALRQSAMAQEERNRLLEEERKQLEAISGINRGFARLGTTFEDVMSDAVGNFLDKVQIDLAAAGGAEGILDAGAGQLVINLEKARKAITDVTNWEHQLSGASGRSAALAAERKEVTDKWWDDYKDLSDNARHLDNMMSSGAHSVSSYLERIISGGPSNEKLFKRIADQLGGFGEIQALYREWQDDDTSYAFSSWLPQVGHDYVTAIIGSTESIDAAYDQAIGDISSGNYASRLQERIAEALAPFDAGSLKDLTKIEWETVDAIREVEAGFGGLNTILNESGEINADLAAAIKAAIDNVEQIEKVFRDSFQESFAGAMGVELDSIGSAFDEVAKKYSEAAFSQQERLSIELRAHQQRVMQFGDLGITADISISKFRELFEAAQGAVDGETLGRWWAAADAMSDMSNTLDKISNLDPSLTADPRLGGLNDYLQSVHDYVRDQSSMIKDSYRAQVAAVEQWQTVAKNLRDYVEKIRISELSPYDPGQKLELASESFARLLVEAEAGDLEAARQLSGAADAYLKQADSYYGRSDAYVSVFDEVAESLDRMGVEIGAANNDDTIERLNQAMLSEQQKLARYAERELQWAQEQAYILTGIEGALSGWPEKFGKIIGGLADSIASAVTASKPERSEAGTASEVATGTYTPPDEQRSFYDRAVEGGISHYVAKVWSGLPENTVKALDKALTSGGRIPAFAKGGDHSGGIRLVGERGPELEVTGPSRIFNADDTRKILAGDNAKPQVIVQTDPALITEMQQLRAEVAQLRSEQQRANSKAEKQRDDQNRTSDAMVRAAKAPVVVI